MTKTPNPDLSTGYGFDLGDNSFGAWVFLFRKGMPVRVLESVVHIHDGGADPDSKGKASRKATAGIARRARRALKHRKHRLAKLRAFLEEKSIPAPKADAAQTWQPWLDRDALAKGYIADDAERAQRLGRAIMHMAHHRGWRNPWLKSERLLGMPTPSEPFLRMRSAAAAMTGANEDDLLTVASIAVLAAENHGQKVRPRVTQRASKKRLSPEEAVELALANGWLFSERIRQEDVAAELKMICDTQRLGDEATNELHELVFHQEEPKVKEDAVGRDPLDAEQRRAPVACLEFQEFRIRDKVANLRRGPRAARVPLPGAEKR
nr:hypothetical protein [Actinomycetota bacterium]